VLIHSELAFMMITFMGKLTKSMAHRYQPEFESSHTSRLPEPIFRDATAANRRAHLERISTAKSNIT
jgi:hypothetical protein